MSSKSVAWLSGAILFYAILFWTTRIDAQQLQVRSGETAASDLGGVRSGEVAGLRLVQFNGGLMDQIGRPMSGVVGIETAVYKDQQGGAALWSEIQNVQLDSQGNYSVLLGATTGEGVPLEIFSSSEPRWLGVRALVPGSEEQPRLRFVSVPYALKAADADTLGGKPISAFVLNDSKTGNPSAASNEKGAGEDGHTAAITAGTTGSLAKFINDADLGDTSVVEVGAGNLVTPGSYTGAAHWVNGFGSATNANGFAMSAPNTLLFATNAQNSLTIDPSANVTALGSVTSAAHWLNGFASATNANGFAMSAPNTLLFSSNAQPRMTISSNGDVGIGTTSPTTKLDVIGTVKAAAFSLPATTGVMTLGGNRFLHGFGTDNTFLGANAGNFTTTSHSNTASGSGALQANTTGGSNMASGAFALGNNTTGSENTASGSSALLSNITGSSNTAHGALALYYNTAGSSNLASGYSALYYNNTGSENTASGAFALYSNTAGSSNLASGHSALYYNTTGSENTAIGVGANQYSTTGVGNTAVGHFAGAANLENANITGSNNTFIGYQAGPGTSTQLTNATAVGANALVSTNNALVLGDSAVSVGIGTPRPLDKLDVTGDVRVGTDLIGCVKDRDGTVIAGTCSSDARLKRNIAPFENLLEKIVAMQPVYFDWRSEEYPEFNFGPSRSFGLIAQEVEKVLPEMVTEDHRGYKAVKYSQLPLMLLEAVRELRAESNDREARLLETVKEQQSLIQQLLSDVEGLKAHLR